MTFDILQRHSSLPACRNHYGLAVHRTTDFRLARRLGAHERVVRRMLHPRHATKAEKIQAALALLGKQMPVEVRDAVEGRAGSPVRLPLGRAEREGVPAMELQLLILLRLFLLGRAALVAENLFLRKQLALFQERKARPRKASTTAKLSLIALTRFFHWQDALVLVRPETFIGWRRQAFRAFRHWKSRKRGRPPLPRNLRELIREMAADNPAWGRERIADELSLNLGVRVSPRTVRKYLDASSPRGGRTSNQRWATFVRNHAKGIVACGFMVCATESMRLLYVFVAMEAGSRRILHTNVTAHPTAEWTLQQFRECLAYDHPYRYLIHDRDSIFSASLDSELKGFGVRVLRTPVRAPKANACCERLIGTIRCQCLDFLIPLNERHLRWILKEFVTDDNRGRPHSALGPGFPEPPETQVRAGPHRHRLLAGHRVRSTAVRGGLHHEYRLEGEAA